MSSSATQNSGRAKGGVANLRPWKPGQSGNPAGRPKGLARVIREMAPADKLADFYLAVFRGDAEAVGMESVSMQDRLKAGEWLSDRGYGKAPTHAPVEGENPLELDAVDRELSGLVEDLASRREVAGDSRPAARELAAPG